MNVKYSVIIPVYNAEKTINRCIASLFQSKRDDVELILVNDGSTDNTEQICMDYAKEHENVCYFFKSNGGVSSARNVGIEKAKGKYITFVDSDDFVKNEYFEVMDKALCKEPDFVLFGHSVYDGHHYVQYSTGVQDQHVAIDQKTVKIFSDGLQNQQLNSPGAKIFKRQIIEDNKIRFDERLPIGEDKVFVVQYIMHIVTANIVNSPIYIISIENQDSLSRKKRNNLCDHILLEHKLLFQAINISNLDESCRKKYYDAITYSYYRSAYTVIFELHKFGYSKKHRLEGTKKICHSYNDARKCKARKLKCVLLSLPIKLYMCRTIDFILRKRCIQND